MDTARYRRQITLTGAAAQQKLSDAHVAVIGAGGLGSPALLYLAGAGVGRITLIDDDVVDLSNLHRQVIHTTDRIGAPKVTSSAQAVAALNPDVELIPLEQRLTWDNAEEILAGVDIILDGADNFDTRHIASHAAARLGVPHVWASILGYESQLSVFWAGRGPVYEDLFPTPPAPGVVPSCAQAGVLGPVVGVTGSAMAMEALKIIMGVGEPLVGTLGYYDSLSGRWEYIPVTPDPAITEQILHQAPPRQASDTPVVDEVEAIPAGATIIDVREPAEFELFHIPGAINVPLSRILDGFTPDEVVAKEPIVVQCAGGVRSAQAVAALEQRGITGLVSLRGGIDAWHKQQST
ncbi:ThiF family adenylyltransferase [Corynebacterium cystitidis]|uniref:Adenylyltransferase and sulfurtransferase n=1 Tax=Corynebacterium cystitidis DSM 20524 TaxID=1121357 RepID=A0A1H9U5S5_9CORY|nr:ThiF family adenylyltransferase [Corynebacterium cystitidis]WJY81197.1 putative adenylyltransferase/sulfurtransferase MoeZ [Corynebacterium cystitidis DSM 20524]SES04930.1 adenylyltransferase and sulfurtransferase [Corynebacterium cystitidis DSM 20524]SNV89508.1 molybdopterin biosynthesis protein MoeB [Corynebacterium cystitidis]